MTKKVALITIHGMGKTKIDYYSTLEAKLKSELTSSWTDISFQNIQYAPSFQNNQNQLWNDISTHPDNDLDFNKLRQFFLYSFSDASSLEHSRSRNKEKYLQVQHEIAQAFRHAYLDVKNTDKQAIILIAHSLGCQVISNYLWDVEHSLNYFDTASSINYLAGNSSIDQDLLSFLKCKSLKNLVTTGCNIPLFNAGLDSRICFSAPNNDFTWDNYYDPDDVLGWPLKQLGQGFDDLVNDHAINAGNILSSWNPASHGAYWDDDDLIKPLAALLRQYL